jgi:hypothetical protein
MTLAPNLLSRILQVLGSVVVLGLAYWFITTSLSPVAIPPPPAKRTDVRFDPAVDVSRNPTFTQLRPLAAMEIEPGETGRLNPFVPAPKLAPVVATSTMPMLPMTTSTSAATTTPITTSSTNLMPEAPAPLNVATSSAVTP